MDNWTSLKNGNDCPLCAPRPDNDEFRKKVIALNVSTLYLDANQTYRGYCILIFDKYHATSIEELPADEYQLLMHDFYTAAKAIKAAFNSEHMNYASLGNLFPHLHIHLIPRYQNDPRWRAPIWTDEQKDMPVTHLEEDEYQSIIQAILDKL